MKQIKIHERNKSNHIFLVFQSIDIWCLASQLKNQPHIQRERERYFKARNYDHNLSNLIRLIWLGGLQSLHLSVNHVNEKKNQRNLRQWLHPSIDTPLIFSKYYLQSLYRAEWILDISQEIIANCFVIYFFCGIDMHRIWITNSIVCAAIKLQTIKH